MLALRPTWLMRLTKSPFSQKGNGLNTMSRIHLDDEFCCKCGTTASYRKVLGLLNGYAENLSGLGAKGQNKGQNQNENDLPAWTFGLLDARWEQPRF